MNQTKAYFLRLSLFFFFLATSTSGLWAQAAMPHADSVFHTLSAKLENEALSDNDFEQLCKAAEKTNKMRSLLSITHKWEQQTQNAKQWLPHALRFRLISLYYLDDVDKAIEVGERLRALPISKNSLVYVYSSLITGLCYTNKGEHIKAYNIYQAFKNKMMGMKEDVRCVYYNNYAIILKKLDSLDLSLVYDKKLLAIDKKNNDPSLAVTYNNIAYTYLDLGRNKEALLYLDSAWQVVPAYRTLQVKRLIMQNKYTAWNMMGNTDSAFYYLEKVRLLNNDIFEEKLHEEVEGVRDELELQQEINEVQQREKQREQQVYLLLILLLVGLLLAVLAFFIYRLRVVQAQKQQLSLEQKLLRLQMTPHFLFNSLSVIQAMVSNRETKLAVNYIAKFSRLLRIVLDNSRHQWVSLHSELEAVQHYVALYNMRSDNKTSYTAHIEVGDYNTHNIMIHPMFLQPYVENAFVHAFTQDIASPAIEVHIVLKDKLLHCQIIDNGIGVEAALKAEKDYPSVSGVINQQRLNLMLPRYKKKSKIRTIDRKQEGRTGTIVELNIPFKTKER